NLRKTDGENSVAILPREVLRVLAFGFNPQRRASLHFLDHRRRLAGSRQRAQQMDMILDPAHDNWLAVEIGQNSAKVAVQFLPENFVAQEWSAFLCREHRMHQNLCERLWHGFLVQPFQGSWFVWTPTQRSSCLPSSLRSDAARATLG